MAPWRVRAARSDVDLRGHRSQRDEAQLPGDRLRLLGSCPLFRNLEVAELECLLRDAHDQGVARGGYYFRQGDPARGIYVLLRGTVRLAQAGSGGRRVIAHFVRPPEPFGYALEVNRRRYSASAQAVEDSQALVWDAVAMDRFMVEHPAIALNGFRLLAERVQEAWTRFRTLATEPVEPRIARALLRLAHPARGEGKGSEGVERVLALSQRDLAEHVGTTPYTVNRVLRRWEQAGLVDVGRERVLIHRPYRLEAFEKITAAARAGTDRGRSLP